MENTLDKSIQRLTIDFQNFWKSSRTYKTLFIPLNHYRLKIKKDIRFSRISARCMLICAILLRLPSELVLMSGSLLRVRIQADFIRLFLLPFGQETTVKGYHDC